MIATRRRRWPVLPLLAALSCAPAPLPAQDQEGAGEDQAVIEKLRDEGVDLSSPHGLEFAFYFPSLEGAQRTADQLAAEGFTGSIAPAGGGADYFLFVHKAVMVDASVLHAMRATFESLAAKNGGRYEGWGMP